MNTISYCLFGDDPMYHVGAIRNAEDAKWAYPGWEVRVYSALEEKSDTNNKLKYLGATVRHIEYSKHGPFTTKLNRLRVIYEDFDVGYFMMRDVDSRFTHREIAAVHEWLNSADSFHVMRDHPSHKRIMMAGMWGGRKGMLRDTHELFLKELDSGRCDELKTDQQFLADVIWPRIKNDVIQHDSCTRYNNKESIPYPTGIGDFRFIGEQIDENDKPKHHESWKARYDFIKSSFGMYA